MGSTVEEKNPMQAETLREHKWLTKLAGEWESEGEAEGPDGEKFRSSGTEAVRTLGDLWTLFEGSGEMPGGGNATTLMTLGFDPARGRFAGSWVGSMATYHWVYEGSLDSSGKVLTLDCEGPAMEGEGTARYQDIIEIVDEDHRLLRARVQAPDGQWNEFMVTRYERKK
jgi:hypothetical protein